MKLVILGLFVFAMSTLVGCREEWETRETERMYVRQMNNIRGQEGSLSGSYFMLMGSVHGKMETKTRLAAFVESSPGVARYIELDMKDVVFVLDSGVKRPYIIVQYSVLSGHNDRSIEQDFNHLFSSCFCRKQYLIYCSHDVIPEGVDPISLKD